jgi:hypothetical protein
MGCVIDPNVVQAMKGQGVKPGLDMILHLVPYRHLERELEHLPVVHSVRTLASLKLESDPGGGPPSFRLDDPVARALDDWYKASRSDYSKILERLRTVALNENICNPNILKPIRHRDARGLCEVVGNRDHARVFVFYSTAPRSVVVGVGTYWKLGRAVQNERKTQDAAILKAAEYRDKWQDATPLKGFPEWRFLKEKRP